MRSVVEFATNLPCLGALTTEEIRARLEEEFRCRPARVQHPGGVITQWGETVGLPDPRTGSVFHSHDGQAILLDTGPGAEYVLNKIVENIQSPSREEYRRLFLLQDGEILQDYCQDLSFRSWVDQCAARAVCEAPQSTMRRMFVGIRQWIQKMGGGSSE